MAGLVSQSFLSEYPVKVINNGIDLSIFKPTESDFRETHGISGDGIMLLGVAFDWSRYKGLDVFITLANKLPEKYKIVLVGTSEAVDAKLPSNIISIHRTDSKEEMAAIYSAADLFVNPTREDNFPTVNIESLACGTPVVTFETNGSPEIIDETCGEIVSYNDSDGLAKKILEISESNKFAKQDCIARAYRYEQMLKFQEYVELYV